jgi:predicted amidophosphoribosyltransferase
LRSRRYNQSALLARRIRQKTGLSLDLYSLRRIRHTRPQTELKKEERGRNVKRAFQVFDASRIQGTDILLVDDVTTTGSTLNECARTLKKAGAKRVGCLVLATTSIHS